MYFRHLLVESQVPIRLSVTRDVKSIALNAKVVLGQRKVQECKGETASGWSPSTRKGRSSR